MFKEVVCVSQDGKREQETMHCVSVQTNEKVIIDSCTLEEVRMAGVTENRETERENVCIMEKHVE